MGDDPRAKQAWLPESVRVERWRVDQFLKLGFELDVAEKLASSQAVLRDVERLLERGATHALAADIAA